MFKKLFSPLVILLISVQLHAQNNAPVVSAHRIVMQLSSSDTLVWKGLINNLKHLKAGWGDSVIIEVVAHGPGIDFLIKEKTTQHEKIIQYKKTGIEFFACENTLTEKKIPKEAVISEAGFVKMGIGEIVRKQELGWSYIKAGF